MVKILEVEQWKQRKNLEVEKLRRDENFWSGTRAKVKRYKGKTGIIKDF